MIFLSQNSAFLKKQMSSQFSYFLVENEHVSFVLILKTEKLRVRETEKLPILTEWPVGWGWGFFFLSVDFCVALDGRKSLLVMLMYPIMIGLWVVAFFFFLKIQIKKGSVSQSHGGLFLKFN